MHSGTYYNIDFVHFATANNYNLFIMTLKHILFNPCQTKNVFPSVPLCKNPCGPVLPLPVHINQAFRSQTFEKLARFRQIRTDCRLRLLCGFLYLFNSLRHYSVIFSFPFPLLSNGHKSQKTKPAFIPVLQNPLCCFFSRNLLNCRGFRMGDRRPLHFLYKSCY